MKKQTISKIAAIALAAMTVVPMFGVTASADIQPRQGSEATSRGPEITGTAYYLEWSTTENIEKYVLIENSTTHLIEKTVTQSRNEYFVKDETLIIDSVSCTTAGAVYYGYSAMKPEKYQELNNAVTSNNTKQNNVKTGIEAAVANYNKDYNSLKAAKERFVGVTNPTPYKYTDSLGRKVTVTDSSTATYEAVGVSAGTSYSVATTDYKWDNGGAEVTLDTAIGTSNAVEIKKYTVNGTPAPKTMAQLADELKTQYVKVTNKSGVIEATTQSGSVSTPDAKYYINENATVPANGNTSVGGTTTPTNPGTGIYTDYSLTPTATYCWYSTAYPYRYYKDGYTAQLAAFALTGNYGTAAKANVATSIDYRTSVSADYPYVSSVPNRYYKTAADAIQDAKDHGYTNPTAVNYYTNYYNNPYGYLYGYNYGYGTTTAVKDTSTVTIGNFKGWTYVTRTINSARSGASYTVKMNTETEIPSNVLKALYGKNVTVNFKFNSGATLSIKGTDMVSTSAINTNIRYVKNVPSALVKKAVKSNSGVSSAQFSVSGGSLGSTASVTVKFGTNRGGCTATLYRYNASANSLSKVSTSTVKSNGYCTLGNVAQGGEYVIVLS